MKRKNPRKTSGKKTFSARNNVSIPHLLIGITISLLFLIFTLNHKSSAERKVLGITTGPVLLAKGGDDSESSSGSDDHSESSSSGGGSSSSGGSSGSNESVNTSSGSSDSSSSTSNSSNTSRGGSAPKSISNNTNVLCTGPDNKQFQTDFKHCLDLNKEWNHQVTFTVLSRPKKKIIEEIIEKPIKQEQENELKIETNEKPESENDSLEVKTEDNKKRIDIRKAGTRVRIEIEEGKTMIGVKQENENEVALEEQDALEKVNEALKEKDIVIHKTERNTIAIRNGEVEAETHLPLSIDPLTHEMTIETESGVKKVLILPGQAIQNILFKKLISNVESEASVSAQNKTEHVQKAELTELNGEGVFNIKGVLNKKVFGLFEVALPKTILTSAETGEIKKVDESFMSRFLEILSF